MMECPNCKMSIKGGSTFCIHCGAQLGAMGNNQPMANDNTAPANSQPMNMPPISNQPAGGTPPVQNSTATAQN